MALRKRRIKQQGYGLPSPLSNLAPEPIHSSAAPTPADHAEEGQIVVTDANTVHICGGITAGTSTGVWYNLGSGTGNFTTAVATISLTTPLVTNDSADLSLTTTTTGDIIVNSVDSITAGAGDTSSITVDSGDLSLITTTTGDVIFTAVDSLTATAGAASSVTVDSADLSLITTTTGDVVLTSVDSITATAGAASSITVDSADLSLVTTTTGDVVVTAVDSITATAGAASSIIVDSADLTLATTTTGDVNLTSVNQITLNSTLGAVTMTALTDTQAAAAVTINANVGVGVFTGLTTEAAATEVLTVTNLYCTADSAILCSLSTKGANDAQMTITRVKPLAGSFTVSALNNGAQAVNGDLILSFWIYQV